MLLYLVQHGQAKSEDEDPERPLSEEGIRATEDSAIRAAAAGVEVAEIRHSGKRRAQETADIFARYLGTVRGVHAVDGLAPNDDPGPVAADLGEVSEPLMLVGHLPFLARLAGQLVAGDPAREVVRFVNAGVVCLRDTGQGWELVSGD